MALEFATLKEHYRKSFMQNVPKPADLRQPAIECLNPLAKEAAEQFGESNFKTVIVNDCGCQT